MYGVIGMSASSLHRESTDSLMGKVCGLKIIYLNGLETPVHTSKLCGSFIMLSMKHVVWDKKAEVKEMPCISSCFIAEAIMSVQMSFLSLLRKLQCSQCSLFDNYCL